MFSNAERSRGTHRIGVVDGRVHGLATGNPPRARVASDPRSTVLYVQMAFADASCSKTAEVITSRESNRVKRHHGWFGVKANGHWGTFDTQSTACVTRSERLVYEVLKLQALALTLFNGPVDIFLNDLVAIEAVIHFSIGGGI